MRWRHVFPAAGCALLLSGVLLFSGCAWTVIPPAISGNVESVTVFVTDYGRHTRLGLPARDGVTVCEWGFGDWDYYALENTGAWSGLRAVSVFGRSTLARRSLPGAGDLERYRTAAGGVRTVAIEVGRDNADRLLAELEALWLFGLESGEIHRGDRGLGFVRTKQRYHLLRNSNAQTAAWLRDLGCEVTGTPILSNFRLHGQ